MKTLFPGHYRPSQRQFDELWKTAIVVPDTNVLLNLYRYSTETRDRLVKILTTYKDRLWLPHQAAKEFHRNRLKVIADQVDAYRKIRTLLDEHSKQIEGDLAAYNRHWFIDTKEHLKALEKVFESAKAALERQQEKHPNLLEDDPVLDSITELFDGRVGNAFDDTTLSSLFKNGEQRYARRIPPGFADAKDKSGEEKFGDLVIWQQILEHAKATNKPVILVTDDNKEDWWWRFQGKTIGPRPELVQEMRDFAAVAFYMYKTDQFMEYARSTLQEQVSEEVINEVRSLSRDTAVSKRLKAHLAEQEMHIAERMRDLLNKKAFLEQSRVALDQRLEEFDTTRDPYDGHLQSMDPSDRRLAAERAALLAERYALEQEKNAVRDELAQLSSDVSELSLKHRNLKRHGNRVMVTSWLSSDQSDIERAIMTDAYVGRKDPNH